MTKIEFIIYFMKQKTYALKYVLTEPQHFFEIADSKEIESWNTTDIDFLFEKLYQNMSNIYNTQKFGLIPDSNICPWCIINAPSDCTYCKYGSRHGYCNVDSSEYQNVIYNICNMTSTNLISIVTYIKTIFPNFFLNMITVMEHIDDTDCVRKNITSNGKFKLVRVC